MKGGFPYGLLWLRFNLRHPGSDRSLPTPRDRPGNFSRRPFEDGFHATVAQVADPAAQSEHLGFLAG